MVMAVKHAARKPVLRCKESSYLGTSAQVMEMCVLLILVLNTGWSVVKTVVRVVGRAGNRRRALAKVLEPNFVELCVDDAQHLLLPQSYSGLGCKGKGSCQYFER